MKKKQMSEDQTPAPETETSANEASPAAAPTAPDAGQFEALKAEAAALREQVLRYAADMENTRRRAEREANDARAYAIQKFARDLLGVADNLARATDHAPADHPESVVSNFVIGVELTEKELQNAFERNGLKRIDPAKGERFDPHKHQAMTEQAGGDVAPGAILQVMQPGYELLGRLIRPAMVVVAAKASGKTDGAAGPNPYAAHDSEGDAPGSGGSVDRRA